MADEPDSPVEPHPLDNRGRRKSKYHRGLLLYAMQDDDLRTNRATASAMGAPEATVRTWIRRYDWKARVDAAGPTVQVEAIRRYRQTYMAQYGDREIHRIERNMSVPVLPTDLMPDGDRPGPAEVLANKREREDPKVDSLYSRLKNIGKHVVAKSTKRMQDPKWEGVPPRELHKWMKMLMELEDMDRPLPVSSGVEVVDTARVRLAREQGTDVIEAHHEDALELVALTGALLAKEEAKVLAFPSREEAG